jgi:energy-coupling factor transporter ATP-binding protein EcfA2
MTDNVPIAISDNIRLDGVQPIVMIGPNGSGKTRHAAQLATKNDGDMIGAVRNLALSDNITVQSIERATQQLRRNLRKRRSRHWEIWNEIDQLFIKLIAEDSSAAVKFRNEYAENRDARPEETTLMTLSDLWSRVFPGRTIDFSKQSPKVYSDYLGGDGYPARQMSDGERVAIYLAGRVLDSEKRIIIVDEPEVHFHSRLAARFWNELESLRPDCRFVYVTHDLPFALSRQDARFVVIQPNVEPELIDLDENLPVDLAETLLAAATFSIFAKRIVFCEGDEGTSIDQQFYSSWFRGDDTAVIPVGSSRDVIRGTRAFSNSDLVTGLTACGIIDRDYWPDQFLTSLDSSIDVLPFHEIENIFCLEGVFVAVAKHLSQSRESAEKDYARFMTSAVEMFSGGVLNKQISERFRKRCEHQTRLVLNKLQIDDEIDIMQSQHIAALEIDNWNLRPDKRFAEERKRLETALGSTGYDFLEFFPGKVFIGRAANSLGLDTQAYIALVRSALAAGPDSSLTQLGSELEVALEPYLPSRELQATEENEYISD